MTGYEMVGPPAISLELARLANDEPAGLVQRFPDRFVGFAAALPLNDVPAAVHELDHRGRGNSGDTAPYAVDREVEDLDVLIRCPHEVLHGSDTRRSRTVVLPTISAQHVL